MADTTETIEIGLKSHTFLGSLTLVKRITFADSKQPGKIPLRKEKFKRSSTFDLNRIGKRRSNETNIASIRLSSAFNCGDLTLPPEKS